MSDLSTQYLQDVVIKLLNKAGRDPRVTPRLLRQKAEQKMNLDNGSLKPRRIEIKRIIFNWWEQEQLLRLQQLSKLAKALGLVPFLFKGLKELPTTQGKADELDKRLREKNITFSRLYPTDEEIESLRQQEELKQARSEVDPNLIIDSNRKRISVFQTDSNMLSEGKVSDNPLVISKRSRHNLELDEEADFIN